jgi:hypothetical protein
VLAHDIVPALPGSELHDRDTVLPGEGADLRIERPSPGCRTAVEATGIPRCSRMKLATPSSRCSLGTYRLQ